MTDIIDTTPDLISSPDTKLLTETPEEEDTHYSYFPIQSTLLEGYYQRHKNIIWTAQEIEYAGDRKDWKNLDENTKTVVKFTLFFFAQFDGIVNENLIEHFKHETSYIKEAANFYSVQEFCEVGHNETYSNLIETLIVDPEEKRKAFNAIKYYPSIRKIADWVFKWMDETIPLPERVVAFACLEGIFFSSAFATIYWIKRRNVLKGLCKANEFIARDEALHTEFAVALYHTITEGKFKRHSSLSKEKAHEIITSAVTIISEFTKDALKVDMLDLSSDDMIKYVKCTADTLSSSLGFGKIYKVPNPFDWMLTMTLPNKTNFFESRVSEYGKVKVSDFEFDLDAPY